MENAPNLHMFYQNVGKRCYERHELYGQALFNQLAVVRPDIAKKICGTNMDPFYAEDTDFSYSVFTKYLESVWY